jgi:hypothetical protein
MLFEPGNFLYMIKQTVMGRNDSKAIGSNGASFDGGIQKDLPFNVTDFALLGASVVVAAFDTHAMGLKAHATTASVGTLDFTVPREYDEASDQFVLNLLIAQAAQVTDTNVKFTVTPAVLTPGSNTVSTVAAQTVTTPAVTLLPVWYQFNMTGLSLKRQQVVYMAVTVANNATTGDEPYILGAYLTIASGIVSYNDTDTSDSADGSTEFGVALR